MDTNSANHSKSVARSTIEQKGEHLHTGIDPIIPYDESGIVFDTKNSPSKSYTNSAEFWVNLFIRSP